MSKTIITLENISCTFKVKAGRLRFKEYEALRDISMKISRGETIGIIGRNGAGKSTLLKLIAGIIRPNSGKILRHTPVSVALLTLQLGFSPELSGRDNAIMGAMLLGYTKKEAVARLDDIIAFAELENWMEDPIKTYSSGMKARLGFSVAMEMSPDVLLVDEVLGVGDLAFREKSTKIMKEKMLSGQTVIFVSHQAPTIKELCSRVVWIENGVTQMEGETEEVLDAYQKWVRGRSRDFSAAQLV